jgi:hypothetical protein
MADASNPRSAAVEGSMRTRALGTTLVLLSIVPAAVWGQNFPDRTQDSSVAVYRGPPGIPGSPQYSVQISLPGRSYEPTYRGIDIRPFSSSPKVSATFSNTWLSDVRNTGCGELCQRAR